MSLNFQSLLVVTYGRSGSTLLQGLLNTIPGCVVRGENNNFCHGLFLAWQSLTRSQVHREEIRPEDPWYGAGLMSVPKFIASARDIVEVQLMGDTTEPRPACLGFKEIRYLQTELSVRPKDYPAHLRDYLRFLGEVMPKLGVIFLTRDHDQVCRSAWWRDDPETKVRSWLTAFEQAIKGFRVEGVGTYQIDYADVLANGAAMRGLFEFLGADYVPEQVASVLSRKHSFQAQATRSKGAADGKRTSEFTESAAPGAAAWRAEVVETTPSFACVMPDKPALSPGQPGLCTWNGVVVARKKPQDVHLSLRLPDGTSVPAEWGLASPWAAGQFPDWDWAARARYRLQPFVLQPGESVVLVAHEAGGDQVIARLERQA